MLLLLDLLNHKPVNIFLRPPCCDDSLRLSTVTYNGFEFEFFSILFLYKESYFSFEIIIEASSMEVWLR